MAKAVVFKQSILVWWAKATVTFLRLTTEGYCHENNECIFTVYILEVSENKLLM